MTIAHMISPFPAPTVDLSTVLPDDSIDLVAPDRTPPTAPLDARGLVVRAIRLAPDAATREPHPDDVDTADVFVAAWLREPLDARYYAGDVVLQLTATGRPGRVDVEAFVAMDDVWVRTRAWQDLDERWPQDVARKIHEMMAFVTDADYQVALRRHAAAASPNDLVSDPAPDALAALIDAGLIEVGSWLRCGSDHQAIVTASGMLADRCPNPGPLAPISTVHSGAADIAGCLVNGWHLWRTPTGELLNEQRVRLAARS